LVGAHHKLHETLGAANPRLIQREMFRNGSVAASVAKRSHGRDAAKTGRQWWRLYTNSLRDIFGYLGCGNRPDRLLQNRYFSQARMNVCQVVGAARSGFSE
jgi:hypothetical protein